MDPFSKKSTYRFPVCVVGENPFQRVVGVSMDQLFLFVSTYLVIRVDFQFILSGLVCE